MTSITVTLIGAKGLMDKLGGLSGQVPAFMQAAVEEGAGIIRNEAVALAPFRTGTLRRSITMEIATSGLTVTATVGPQEPYGKYIEFGTGVYAEGGGGRQAPWSFKAGDGSWVTTRGQKPQPFLRPAFDSKRGEAEAEIKDVFGILVTRSMAQ